MQILIRIIIPALIPVALGILLSNIDKSNGEEMIKNLTKEHIVIRLPKAYLWVGCIDVLFFVICFSLMIYYPNDTATTWVWILFSFFVLFGVIIIAETQIWRVQIFRRENYFLYRTMFCRNHRIQYKDCVSYKFGTNTLILETEKKTFYVDNKATNIEFLLAALTQHKVKEIK